MLKRFKNTLKGKKGQIGEILVVVVLIILAVLGIVKYVMPMFDKNKEVANAARSHMDNLSKTANDADLGVMGDMVPAQTVINIYNKYCNIATVTIQYQNTRGATTYTATTGHDSLADATNTTYEMYENSSVAAAAPDTKVDRMATYKIQAINQYADGSLKDVLYVRQ